MEAVLESSAVAALLSLTATFRWRMYALGASGVSTFTYPSRTAPHRIADPQGSLPRP